MIELRSGKGTKSVQLQPTVGIGVGVMYSTREILLKHFPRDLLCNPTLGTLRGGIPRNSKKKNIIGDGGSTAPSLLTLTVFTLFYMFYTVLTQLTWFTLMTRHMRGNTVERY